MTRFYPALRRRFGFRGIVQLIFGGLFVAIGIGVLTMPDRVADLIHTHLPVAFRLCIWAGAGTLGIAAAFFQPRWEGDAGRLRLERWAWGTLAIGPAERCVSFLWACISTGNLERLTGMVVYLLLTLLLIVVARWPESPLILAERMRQSREPGHGGI